MSDPNCDVCFGDGYVEPIGGYEPDEPGDRCPRCNAGGEHGPCPRCKATWAACAGNGFCGACGTPCPQCGDCGEVVDVASGFLARGSVIDRERRALGVDRRDVVDAVKALMHDVEGRYPSGPGPGFYEKNAAWQMGRRVLIGLNEWEEPSVMCEGSGCGEVANHIHTEAPDAS